MLRAVATCSVCEGTEMYGRRSVVFPFGKL